FDPVQVRRRLIHHTGWKMNPADKSHRARRERRLIVTKERARPRQRHSHIVGVLHLPEISDRRRRRILRSKHAQHKSRAVHHGHGHIDIPGIHRCLHDVLHVDHLQSLDRRNRRRHRCAIPTSAPQQQERQRSSDSPRQDYAEYQPFLSLSLCSPRFHRLPQCKSCFHHQSTCVRITLVCCRSTPLPVACRELVNVSRPSLRYRMTPLLPEKCCSRLVDIVI